MDAFIDLCVELLQPLGPVRVRRMFGGHGIYVDGLFMALVISNQLYLKTDDLSRGHFLAAGCEPFSYSTKTGERQVISYYQPPEETLESPPLMLPWARLAFEAALRAANAKVNKPAAARKAPARKPSTAKKTSAKKATPGRS
jgi:DNA transformation protein